MLNPGKDMGTCEWQNKMRDATMFDNKYTVGFYNSFKEALPPIHDLLNFEKKTERITIQLPL